MDFIQDNDNTDEIIFLYQEINTKNSTHKMPKPQLCGPKYNGFFY